jgi:hypothetical protein
MAAIANSVVKIGMEGGMQGYGMILANNTLLCPTHYFVDATSEGKPRMGGIVTVEVRGRVSKFQLTSLNLFVLSCPEVCVIRCAELPGTTGILGKIWSNDSLDIQSFDEVEVVHERVVGSTVKNRRCNLLPGMACWCVNDVKTVMGDCGAVYVARFNSTWRIIAMHYLVIDATLDRFGAIVTQHELRSAIARLGGTYQGVVTPLSQLSRKPAEVEFLKFPVKSETWVAMTRGAQVYGYGEVYPPMAGSTVKTKMLPSLIRDDVADLEEEFCGEKGYWRFPEFRGRMEDEGWVSPYTNAFVTQNLTVIDEPVAWMAVLDYLGGIQDLDREGWRPLSENEAIVGVPGSYIHSANLKTSVGPPFNQSKRYHIVVDDERIAFVSPELRAMIDELRAISRHSIPAAVGICTLKDEPVKPGKKPRVFTCLSASYNLLLKETFAPIKAFMRANRTFFESWVGVDMTSAECRSLVDHLRVVNDTLDRLSDGDARQLDKSWKGIFFDLVAAVFYVVARFIGHPKSDLVFTLVQGLKHTRYLIKGDLFSVFWNPSGQDATVEFNGLLMSLMTRYVFYRTHGSKYQFDVSDIHKQIQFSDSFVIRPFRRYVALGTYGDDTVAGYHMDYTPDFEREARIWSDEVGITVTSGAKDKVWKLRGLHEVQFLKRTFVWSAEYGRFLAPLDRKSLARSLVIKRESILTGRDHACVSMTEVLREAVYHGAALYDRLLERFTLLATKYDLHGNPYLKLLPFTHWVEPLKSGSFVSWVPPSYLSNVRDEGC